MTARQRGRGARCAILGMALLIGATSTGCATLRATLRGYDLGPHGIARPQQRLRDALAQGNFVRALAWREDDALLDRLTRATSAYYARQFVRAGALLDTAALLSDDRITERIAYDALTLVTNDNARPWRPRRTERLFIPYYGMLAHARAERWEDAAVEARRLLALLAQSEDHDAEERPLHAMLEHLAGAVLQRAGRSDEASVAYRVAHGWSGAAPERVASPSEGEGELVVVLERGFVAHRVTERIDIRVGDDERRRERDPRRDERGSAPGATTSPGADPRRTTSASSVLGPVGPSATSEPAATRRHRKDDAEYWIAVAFPALRRSTRPLGSAATIRLDGAADAPIQLGAVVDDAAAADERRERLAMLARATVRAGAKYALAKAAREKKGELAGTLANYGASLLERADVRSWHLLPQEIRVERYRVPAGSHVVRLETTDGRRRRQVDLGSVTVLAGAITIAPFRVWRDAPRELPDTAP